MKNKIQKEKWSFKSPKKGRERNELLTVCGPKCFLLPKLKKFPICSSLQRINSEIPCQYNKSGIISAYKRAKQYKYENIAKNAKSLLKKIF